MKGQLKGAWVLINGKNVGWPVDRSAKGDSIRAAIISENNETAKRTARSWRITGATIPTTRCYH